MKLSVIMCVLFIGGCATTSIEQLNDPKVSQMEDNVIPLDPSDQFPYETKELAPGVSVGYNLFYSNNRNFPGYRLTLVFHNGTSSSVAFSPRVTLQDARGIELQLADVREVLSRAAMLAGEPIPATFILQGASSYYSYGTVTNMSNGNRYLYSGYSTPASGGFAGGMASGMVEGAMLGSMIRAKHDREDGEQVLQLTGAYWLKSDYPFVSPGSTVVGILYYPARSRSPLPIKIKVGAATNSVTFLTKH